MRKSHYQVLGVPSDASEGAIVHARGERIRQLGAHAEAKARVDEAMRVLMDPEKRRQYDKELLLHAAAGSAPADRSPRRSGLPWLLLGASVAVVAALVAGRGRVAPASPGVSTVSPKPVKAVAASPARPEESAAAAAPDSGKAASPDNPPEVVPVAAVAPPPAPAQPLPTRPPREAGFDPAYLAWSVYNVVGVKGRGSGVMVERDKVVTNCHVIAGSYQPRSIKVINSVTYDIFYPEKITILGEQEDVCLLHVPGAPDYVSPWGNSAALAPGAKTHTVSLPGRQGLTWSTGRFLQRASVGGLDVLLTDNYCRPGVSGGPLFDDQGQVVGITSAGRQMRTRSGPVIDLECVSVTAETARQVMWRTPTPIVISPITYDGVWSGGR